MDYPELNRHFRSILARIPSRSRSYFELVLFELLPYKNIRSIQLMTRGGVSTREFVHKRLPPESQEFRRKIAELTIETFRSPSFPVKTFLFDASSPSRAARQVHAYLGDSSSFTAQYATRFVFHGSSGSFSLEYRRDSSNDAEDASFDFDDPEYQDLIEE